MDWMVIIFGILWAASIALMLKYLIKRDSSNYLFLNELRKVDISLAAISRNVNHSIPVPEPLDNEVLLDIQKRLVIVEIDSEGWKDCAGHNHVVKSKYDVQVSIFNNEIEALKHELKILRNTMHVVANIPDEELKPPKKVNVHPKPKRIYIKKGQFSKEAKEIRNEAIAKNQKLLTIIKPFRKPRHDKGIKRGPINGAPVGDNNLKVASENAIERFVSSLKKETPQT